MIDPTIDYSSQTISLNFIGSTNWVLSGTEITNLFSSGGLMLYPQSTIYMYEPFDSESLDFSNVWRSDNIPMAQSFTQNYHRTSNYIATPGSLADNDLVLTRANMPGTPANTKRTICLWFYDNAHTGGGNEQWFTAQAAVAAPTQRGILALGWDTDSAEVSKYLYSKSGSVGVTTGITRTADWHKLVIQTDLATTVDDSIYSRRVYLDGAAAFSPEVVALPPGSPAPFTTLYRGFALTILDSTDEQETHMDEMFFSAGGENVYESGTAYINIQPESVISFSGVTINDNTTGAWLGSAAYDFRYSSNGGGAFGSWFPLTNEGLGSITPNGDGQDVLQVRVTHVPDITITGLHNFMIPKTNFISIGFSGAQVASSIFIQDNQIF